MNIYCTLTKRGIAAVLALLILGILIGGEFSAADRVGIKGGTNHQRIGFITSLGITPEEELLESAKVTVPAVFGDVYENYNLLQKKAGFDLERYKGLEVTRYTYRTKKGDWLVNLLVFKGSVIGGDVCDARLGGEMLPLEKGILNGKTET